MLPVFVSIDLFRGSKDRDLRVVSAGKDEILLFYLGSTGRLKLRLGRNVSLPASAAERPAQPEKVGISTQLTRSMNIMQTCGPVSAVNSSHKSKVQNVVGAELIDTPP